MELTEAKRRTLADETFEFHDCPRCGYRITQLFIESVRADFGCPRCRASFADFRPIRKKKGDTLDEVQEIIGEQ